MTPSGDPSGKVDSAPRTLPEPLLERERELAQLRDVSERARAGNGGVALVNGAAGIGKSRLLDAVAAEAAQDGVEVLRARGGELARDLGWGVVRELFGARIEAAPDYEREELLSGAAGLARLPLGAAIVPPGPDVAGSAFHGLYWLTSNLAERRPVALIVDDAHLADAPSLRFLLYVSQRAGDLPISVVVAKRTGEPDPPSPPLDSLGAGATVIRPAALSLDAAAILIRDRFGSEPEPEFARACQEVTGGNPFLLGELALTLRRDGLGPTAENAARVREVRPEAIRSAILVRLTALSEDAMRIARAVAILGDGASLHRSAALAGVDGEAAAGAAERLAGVEILEAGLPLRFAHPITRSVVYEEIPEARRAQLHGRAAEILADGDARPEEVAVHLLDTEPRGDPNAARTLAAAAQDALMRGAPDAAASYLHRGLAEPPAEPERPAILAALGQAEAATGAVEAPRRVEAALELVAAPEQRAELRMLLGLLLFAQGKLDASFDTFEHALAEMGDADGNPVAAVLRTGYLGVGILTGAVGDSDLEGWKERIPEPSSDRLGPAERENLTQLAMARVYTADAAGLAAELAERALGGGAMLAKSGVSHAWSIAVSCLFWTDELERAEEEFEIALTTAREGGDLMTAAHVLFGRAHPRYFRGALNEAAADAAAAVEAWRGGWGSQIPYAASWQAMALIELGQLREAESTLAAAGELAEGPYEVPWRTGHARLALARGDPHRAREELLRVEEIAAAAPFYRTVWPWRSDAALAALLVGEDEDARRIAADDLELARSFGAPRSLGVALRAWGLVQEPKEGLAAIREAVEALEGSPSKLELCRALVDLGAVLRRAGQRAESREPLRRGLDLAHRLGARLLERRAEEELRASGARPRRRELSGPESLTPGERRVAAIAAAGATNREIAQQLFLSLRTVETHLTHAYGKLEISSRSELAAALEPGDG